MGRSRGGQAAIMWPIFTGTGRTTVTKMETKFQNKNKRNQKVKLEISHRIIITFCGIFTTFFIIFLFCVLYRSKLGRIRESTTLFLDSMVSLVSEISIF